MLEALHGGYTPPVNLDSFRAAFRRARKDRVGGADKLAKLSGVNRTTIYKIETDKHYVPGIDTVATLIEAMPELTLSEFFSEMERQTYADLSVKSEPDRSRTINPAPRNHGGGDGGADTPVFPTDEDRKQLIRLSRIFAVAAVAAGVDKPGGQASKARARKPVLPRRDRGNRR